MAMTQQEREQKRIAKIKSDPLLHAKYLERKRNEARARGPLDPTYERDRKRKWREKNAERNRTLRQAHHAVENAIKYGRLVKSRCCSRCGAGGEIEAHHWSYKREHWLDVIWLCTICHGAQHGTI